MYRVIKGFFDLQDSDHWYDAGDPYPRNGIKVSEKRIAQLLGNQNAQGTPLIEEVKAAKPEPEAEAKKPVKAKKEAKK